MDNRLDHVDLLRAFGILMMIMGHVAFGSVFKKWIHVFHMPMFFIISGYFNRDMPFRVLLGKRAKSLLVPYLVFGLLHVGISFIRNGEADLHAFYLLFWENTAEGGVPIAGALWFLTAMFFSEVFYWGLKQLKLNWVFQSLAAALISVAGIACATYLPHRLPLAMDVGLVGVGLYQAGSLLKEKFPKALEGNLIVSVVGIIVFSALGFVNGYVNLRQGSYGFFPLFYLNAVGLTIAFWSFFFWVERCASGKKRLAGLFAWFRGIGKDSIIYLCLNQLAILLASDLISAVFGKGSGITQLIQKGLILVLAMVMLTAAQKLIMKTKLRVIIGKW